MKTDNEKTRRFSAASIRAAALLLAGLLFAAGLYAAGPRKFRLGRAAFSWESRSQELSKALAQEVGEVKQKFEENRNSLRGVQGADGKPAHLQQEVVDLIDRTGKDLDQAIERIQEPGLEALRAWSAEEIRLVREKLERPARPVALPPGLSTPSAVAVVTSLGRLPLPELASAKAAAPKKAPKQKAPKQTAPKQTAPKQTAPKQTAPQQPTIAAEKADRLLDQVGEVAGRIFFLAANDDLKVKLWVGSTPKQRAEFRFMSQGELKESVPAPIIVRTNGKRDGIFRGLYSYTAVRSPGAVNDELIQYPSPPGAPTARASERLDLVKGTGFFCCRFDEKYCHHVENENDCR